MPGRPRGRPDDGLPLRAPRSRRRRAARPAALRPGHGRDAGLHARRDLRHGQGAHPRGRPGDRRRDHPGQHLPPVAAPGHRDHRRARRPARLHALERPDPDRFRRLPGLEPGEAAEDRRVGSALPHPDRRARGVPRTRGVDADPACAGLGRRHGLRRVHRAPGAAREGGGIHAAVDALGGALSRRARAAGQPERAVRHLPGRHGRGASRGVREGARRDRLPGVRRRRARGRRGQDRARTGARRLRAAPAGRRAALPDGSRQARGSRRRRPARHRHVRLRDADAERAERTSLHPPRGTCG